MVTLSGRERSNDHFNCDRGLGLLNAPTHFLDCLGTPNLDPTKSADIPLLAPHNPQLRTGYRGLVTIPESPDGPLLSQALDTQTLESKLFHFYQNLVAGLTKSALRYAGLKETVAQCEKIDLAAVDESLGPINQFHGPFPVSLLHETVIVHRDRALVNLMISLCNEAGINTLGRFVGYFGGQVSPPKNGPATAEWAVEAFRKLVPDAEGRLPKMLTLLHELSNCASMARAVRDLGGVNVVGE